MPAPVFNKIKIINLALKMIGIPGTNNQIDPNNADQVMASDAYDMLYPSTIAKEDWRFATKIIQMSKLIETPIIDRYNSVYQMPADYIVAVRTYPNVIFQIYEDKLYSNANELKFEYRYQVDEAKLPIYFVEYMVVVLAHYLSLAIAEKIEYVKVLEQKERSLMDKSAYLDAQSHSNFGMESNPFLDIRNGGFGTSRMV